MWPHLSIIQKQISSFPTGENRKSNKKVIKVRMHMKCWYYKPVLTLCIVLYGTFVVKKYALQIIHIPVLTSFLDGR